MPLLDLTGREEQMRNSSGNEWCRRKWYWWLTRLYFSFWVRTKLELGRLLRGHLLLNWHFVGEQSIPWSFSELWLSWTPSLRIMCSLSSLKFSCSLKWALPVCPHCLSCFIVLCHPVTSTDCPSLSQFIYDISDSETVGVNRKSVMPSTARGIALKYFAKCQRQTLEFWDAFFTLQCHLWEKDQQQVP